MDKNFTYPTGEGFVRFVNEPIGYCPRKPYSGFLAGIGDKFDEAKFYTNILQLPLIALMYLNVNKREKYWKIIVYASMAGIIATLIEAGGIAYVCRRADINNPRPRMFTFFISEIFWIFNEYFICFLNLIKIKKFYNGGRITKISNYVVFALFILVSDIRLYIGFLKARNGVLINDQIKHWHYYSYGFTGLANFYCYIIDKRMKRKIKNKSTDVSYPVHRTTCSTLIFVQVISILYLQTVCLTEHYSKREFFSNSCCKLFTNIKCSFTLILACEAFLTKYHVNTSQSDSSKCTSSYYYSNNDPNDISNSTIRTIPNNNFTTGNIKSKPSIRNNNYFNMNGSGNGSGNNNNYNNNHNTSSMDINTLYNLNNNSSSSLLNNTQKSPTSYSYKSYTSDNTLNNSEIYFNKIKNSMQNQQPSSSSFNYHQLDYDLNKPVYRNA